MTLRSAWTGWITFAGVLLIVVGFLDFIQGLIAVARDKYYALTPDQIIVFDVSTWGWITLIWGIIVVFAGFSLIWGRSWARWFTIVVGCLSFIVQLSFLGGSSAPLWSLTVLALTIVVLYALIVRWDDQVEERARIDQTVDTGPQAQGF
jgi:hypothetical protein